MDIRVRASHDENRQKVCGPCGKKIVFSKTAKKRKFLINSRTEKLIQTHINNDYKLSDRRYPLSICRTCYLTLFDAEKQVFKRPFQVMPDYQSIVLPRELRTDDDLCNCYICLTGRYVGHVKPEVGKGHKRNLNNVISTPTGRYGASKISKIPKKSRIRNKKKIIKLCSECGQKIGKGLSHKCLSSKTKVSDIVKIIPESVQDQVASYVIKSRLDDQFASRHIKDKEVELSTKGSKLRVTINQTKPKEILFSEESLDNVRVNLGFSSKEMKKVTNYLRSNVGKNSVPAHYAKHMSKKSKILKDVYKLETLEFECKGKKKCKRPVVFADAEELLDAVVVERKFEGDVLVKVMADGGQGFFKISMSIFPENYSANPESKTCDSDDESPINDKKRTLYSQGGTLAKRARLLSVKRVVILGIVPDISETYENVKLLFDKIRINNISFKFVSDFKLLLIINGQQTASAMYPCPYCFVSLKDLRKTDDTVPEFDINAHSSNSQQSPDVENLVRLKTYGDLRKDFEKFELTGRNLKYTQECHSTINSPLFEESDSTTVLEKCIVPELHILQGFVNHLFWKGLVPLLGRDKALMWPQSLGLVSKNYQGETFEGNACRALLKKADQLNSPEIYENVGYFAIVPYMNAFKNMDKVVHCAFTSGQVGDNLNSYLEELKKSLDAIEDVSETLKIHVLRCHVKDCLEFIDHNLGLGYWSEQSGESIHREFLHTWERYKVNAIDSTSYPDQLLKAVVEFSSLNT